MDMFDQLWLDRRQRRILGHCEMLKTWQEAIIDRVQEDIRQQMTQLHESCVEVLQEAYEAMTREEGVELVERAETICEEWLPLIKKATA